MAQLPQIGDRRTTVDEIFDELYAAIASMRLRPGDKISEADIAARFGVSRQPVRDAFSRLHNLDLLVIRPQRATEVKRFSLKEIEKSRFIRAAVETEILRRAARCCDAAGEALLESCLNQQRQVIQDGDQEAFGRADYAFHKALCQIAKVEFAFEVISTEKAKVDRLCILALEKDTRMPCLLEDHETITRAVVAGDGETAVKAGMIHLARLDATIESISKTRSNYFET